VVDELSRCRGWIEAALAHAGGTHGFDDVAAAILDRRMQLWAAPKGCLVTEVADFPRKRVLNVFLGGGEMRQLVGMKDDVEAWARSIGCDATTITGRRGWSRVFARHGWRPAHVTLIKET